ncbi:MAG: fructose-bisphosphate aldolase class I [Euryarchaeota archaeon]|nr:fructose-bisphosphate aldolase class I [Euryarchaeota archaeon]
MPSQSLEQIAQNLVAFGKGILAADESNGTMSKRLEAVNVEPSEHTRRAYRTAMFSSEGIEEYISGVILFDETIRQKMDDGTPIPDYLISKGIIPGIKVDTGAKPLSWHEGETVTEGLDGLRGRCEEYYRMGARFAKWRAVIKISGDLPSAAAISVNAHALARYAAICQEQGIVPIIEPEVLMSGPHGLEQCARTTSRILKAVYSECKIQGVNLKGTILKPNMVLSGAEAEKEDAESVGRATAEVLKETVPQEVAGVAFLSGGQSDIDATSHLNETNLTIGNAPWPLTFSFGRALLADALSLWSKSDVEGAQARLRHRSKMNALAAVGAWSSDLEV